MTDPSWVILFMALELITMRNDVNTTANHGLIPAQRYAERNDAIFLCEPHECLRDPLHPYARDGQWVHWMSS